MTKEKAGRDGVLYFFLALIVILILIICIAGYYYLIKDNSEIKETTENTNVVNKEDMNNEKIINKTTIFKSEGVEYKEITKDLSEDEWLYITSIDKKNGSYEIKGVKFEEYIITEEELKELKKGAKIIIDAKEYIYTNKVEYDEKDNYLKLNTNEVTYDYFKIRNKEDGTYILEGNAEFFVTRKMTNEYVKAKLDANAKYIEYDAIWNEEKESLENKEMSIEEFYNNFTFVEPKDYTYPSGIYKLTFKDDECIEISCIETEH